MKKIAVLTSGGDAPGMNSVIRSVTRYAISKGIKVIGIAKGYQGLLDKEFRELSSRDVSNIISRGGTILKSGRCEKFFEKEARIQSYQNIIKDAIEALIIIGGEGSFKGALVFHREFNFPVVGIPATIDNDINGTQRTLGFDTALNTAMDAIDKIKDTATSMDRIFVIEVMGRFSGAIAVYSALSGGAEEVIIPEQNYDLEEMVNEIEEDRKKGKKSWIVIVAEGAAKTQDFVKNLRKFISDVRVTVIGHIQRGGSPSACDRFLGAIFGKTAVDVLLEGKTHHAIGWVNNEVIIYPLEEAIKPKVEDFSYLYNLIRILT